MWHVTYQTASICMNSVIEVWYSKKGESVPMNKYFRSRMSALHFTLVHIHIDTNLTFPENKQPKYVLFNHDTESESTCHCIWLYRNQWLGTGKSAAFRLSCDWHIWKSHSDFQSTIWPRWCPMALWRWRYSAADSIGPWSAGRRRHILATHPFRKGLIGENSQPYLFRWYRFFNKPPCLLYTKKILAYRESHDGPEECRMNKQMLSVSVQTIEKLSSNFQSVTLITGTKV